MAGRARWLIERRRGLRARRPQRQPSRNTRPPSRLRRACRPQRHRFWHCETGSGFAAGCRPGGGAPPAPKAGRIRSHGRMRRRAQARAPRRDHATSNVRRKRSRGWVRRRRRDRRCRQARRRRTQRWHRRRRQYRRAAPARQAPRARVRPCVPLARCAAGRRPMAASTS